MYSAIVRILVMLPRSSRVPWCFAFGAVLALNLSAVASAADLKLKPALPPVSVDVVDGDVRVTGAVAVTNTVPVVVQNDMAMQGTVEVLNDSLNGPYFESQAAEVVTGQSAAVLRFDVPSGKRLVVEMITINVDTNDHGASWTFMMSRWRQLSPTGGDVVNMPLPVGTRTILLGDTERTSGVYPVAMRIDHNPLAPGELFVAIARTVSFGYANCAATVHGYLVDL